MVENGKKLMKNYIKNTLKLEIEGLKPY